MDFINAFLARIPPSLGSKAMFIGLSILVGVVLIRLGMAAASRILLKKASDHNRLIARTVIQYAGTTVLILTVLSELGVNLSALLGAAGIVGIAVGFASQTSVSNIISGLFLLGEKPFTVGDVIKVGDKSGIIISIDLMSIKIRTFDNLFIRLPNQMVLNTEVVNITRFPIRRLDLTLSVAYKENIGRVRDVLLEVARGNPFALQEPEPLVIFQNFGQSGIDIFMGVWFLKTDFVALKNSLIEAIKHRLDAEGIEIPFPHLSLYAGEATNPFPVTVVEGGHSPHRVSVDPIKPLQ
jgi:small-conductance mechanosensitive channel